MYMYNVLNNIYYNINNCSFIMLLLFIFIWYDILCILYGIYIIVNSCISYLLLIVSILY